MVRVINNNEVNLLHRCFYSSLCRIAALFDAFLCHYFTRTVASVQTIITTILGCSVRAGGWENYIKVRLLSSHVCAFPHEDKRVSLGENAEIDSFDAFKM